ncbi:unnamed protein product [Didymodactylos carnosus]|uniref:EF-hand domain-containing protein n=1 Tax=Didymodactylos carnosus TaxID=1234261 RepID=A0A814JGY6_9BILA|nr:unnamed protein product [Didymodactylos carnosus]CAF1485906.1 unnamed protein product [Didymodactylos carnosus]CAF3807821.1 unnamed protein product [Didymodactylos carnosus]CAF4275768.1 unnamed protein product [Didymodactylos carnosus]
MAFDGNRDGYLNQAEARDAAEFRAGDYNQDGAMNRAEFSRVENPREFNQYDTNRDGLVDAPEYERGEMREGDHQQRELD